MIDAMVAQGRSPERADRPGADDQRAIRQRLVQIGRLLLGGVDLGEVLQNIARATCEVTGYDRCVVATTEPTQSSLLGRAGHGVAAEHVAAIHLPLRDVPILAEVLAGGQLLVLSGAQVPLAIPAEYVQMFDVTGTLIVIPLSSSSSAGIRGLVFVDRGGSHFTPSTDELETLSDFTDLAALALQNAVLANDSRDLAALLERSRIATELHDGVTQLLFAVDLTLQEVLSVPRLPRAARALVETALADVGRGNQQLRQALYELTQESEDTARLPAPAVAAAMSADDTVREGWLAALEQVIDEFRRRSGIGVDVELRGEGRLPTEDCVALLVRTAREGLANVLKHAQATEVVVVLRRSDHWWMAEVHDDGGGDPTAMRRSLTAGSIHGYGLESLRRQAQRVGGRMWLSASSRLRGLQLTVSVPVGDGW